MATQRWSGVNDGKSPRPIARGGLAVSGVRNMRCVVIESVSGVRNMGGCVVHSS